MDQKLYRIDGVLWSDIGTPYCPKHKMEMDAWNQKDKDPKVFNLLKCEECNGFYKIPRDISDERRYIRRKLRSKSLQSVVVINIDDEAVPIAEDEIRSKDKKFFVKAILTESKIGKRLVIYAGEKGKREKTQIFVEPDIKRISFDHKDIHPMEIFTKVEATFNDGSISLLKKKSKL